MNAYVAPLISVIIPTIGRHSLVAAIASVAGQSHHPVEIILVYDAPDAIPDEAQLRVAAGDCALLIHRHRESKGGAAARNTGISLASGDYVCFLDDDDIYYPGKLSTLLHALERDPSIDAVFGKMKSFDGEKLKTLIDYPIFFRTKVNLLVMNYIHNNATLIRSRVLSSLKFHEPLSRFQDLQFNAELSYRFKVQFVDEFVSEWRTDKRPDKITYTGDEAKIKKDIAALHEVINYLEVNVGISSSWLSFFRLHLFQMYLSLGLVKQSLALLTSKNSFLWRPISLSQAIHARRKMRIGQQA